MSKKIKIKVKKRKVNFKKILLFILVIYIIFFLVYEIINLKIKNIYIIGNNILSDYEIMKIANIDDYPPFIKTFDGKIKKKLLANDYIENVKIERKFFNKLYITIEENNIIAILKSNNKIINDEGHYLDNIYEITDVPVLISNLDEDIFNKFYVAFDKVNKDVSLKISEIEYKPTNLDNLRFLLYMNDGNYVYITLDKIEKLNKYNEIYAELDGKKGILNLDSGNSFEIKE